MSDLNLKIDMDRVQSSVNAAIRPAVDAALATVDIKKMIEGVLTKKPAKAKGRDDSFYYSIMLRGYGAAEDPRPLIEQMVQEGISEMAKGYIQRELSAQKPMLEEAFCQMMKGSQNGLVKAFAKACTKALEDDWTFEMKTSVAHKEPERSYD